MLDDVCCILKVRTYRLQRPAPARRQQPTGAHVGGRQVRVAFSNQGSAMLSVVRGGDQPGLCGSWRRPRVACVWRCEGLTAFDAWLASPHTSADGWRVPILLHGWRGPILCILVR